MVAAIGRGTAVFQKQTFVTAIVRFTHGGVNAHVGGDASENDVGNSALAENQIQIRCAERAFARFVDDRFALFGIKFGNDVPAGFAAHQDSAAGAFIADARAEAAGSPAFVLGQI